MTAVTSPAVFVLEDGTRYYGRAYGAHGRTTGEAVFTTGMTGYQETLSDPSYAGQIVIMTAPHIGNTGTNDDDRESERIWVSGYVVRDASRMVSSHRATSTLEADLIADGIVAISGVDTRAITRRIRSHGAMRSGIFSGAEYSLSAAEQQAIVQNSPSMKEQNLSAVVSTSRPYTIPAQGKKSGTVAVLDLGVKKSTLHYLSHSGWDVVVLPESTRLEELLAHHPDALFYSNGPGDPAASDRHVTLLQETLRRGLPYFGICFGHQLLGRALGFSTYKLPFGHRGINQPVQDCATGRIEITSQNHGFAVQVPRAGIVESPAGFGRVTVSHLSANDDVVEGIRCLDIKAFSVQYHPEAACGPHDSLGLFDRFSQMFCPEERK